MFTGIWLRDWRQAWDQDVAYVFAGGRSGETPKRLLAGTKSTLIVDGFSGYNVVAEVSSRKRAACHAHLRCYFHEALPTAPIAQEAIELILGLYRVEHDAKSQEITGTKKHLISTCETRGINPFAYLADVIPRVQDHPKRRPDELLPGHWARARTDA